MDENDDCLTCIGYEEKTASSLPYREGSEKNKDEKDKDEKSFPLKTPYKKEENEKEEKHHHHSCAYTHDDASLFVIHSCA